MRQYRSTSAGLLQSTPLLATTPANTLEARRSHTQMPFRIHKPGRCRNCFSTRTRVNVSEGLHCHRQKTTGSTVHFAKVQPVGWKEMMLTRALLVTNQNKLCDILRPCMTRTHTHTRRPKQTRLKDMCNDTELAVIQVGLSGFRCCGCRGRTVSDYQPRHFCIDEVTNNLRDLVTTLTSIIHCRKSSCTDLH